jgi:hypothetical protein
MTNKGESFEGAVEEIEKEHGIVVHRNKSKSQIEIIVDSHGRYWRYTADRTFKWRVRPDGSPFYRPLEETKNWNHKWEKIIASEKDKEVKQLADRELLYCNMGGTASQWQNLDRRKEDAKARGKKVHEINEDRKINEHPRH